MDVVAKSSALPYPDSHWKNFVFKGDFCTDQQCGGENILSDI